MLFSLQLKQSSKARTLLLVLENGVSRRSCEKQAVSAERAVREPGVHQKPALLMLLHWEWGRFMFCSSSESG